MRSTSLVVALLLGSALGCSYPLQHVKEDRLDADHSSLLAIGVQVEDRTGAAVVGHVEFNLAKLDANGEPSRCANGNAWVANWPAVASPVADQHRLDDALFQQAEPGKYRLEDITVHVVAVRPNGRWPASTTIRIGRTFEIAPGRAVFLGKLVATILEVSSGVAGPARIDFATVQGEEPFGASWALLQKRHPGLAARFAGAVDRPALP